MANTRETAVLLNVEKVPPENVKRAVGMLYSLIIRFPDLDDMLRPIVQELEKSGR